MMINFCFILKGTYHFIKNWHNEKLLFYYNQIHIYDFTEQFLHELHKGITCGILRVGLNLSKQPPKLIWEPIDTGRSLTSTCFLMIMIKYKKFIQFHFYIR